jgi:hypothetical protein
VGLHEVIYSNHHQVLREPRGTIDCSLALLKTSLPIIDKQAIFADAQGNTSQFTFVIN